MAVIYSAHYMYKSDVTGSINYNTKYLEKI